MKIVFSAADVKEMVQLFLEEHTSFEATNLDIAIIDEQIHVGIDEDLDTVVPEVQEEQLSASENLMNSLQTQFFTQ